MHIEKQLSYLTPCLIPVHLIGCSVNAINSIDKGYGHSYPLVTYLLIGFYLLVVIAVDLYILSGHKFLYLYGYAFYWKLSAVILVLSMIGLTFLDIDRFGVLIAIPLMASPYGILFPILEPFFAENFARNACLVFLLFSLLNWWLCRSTKQHSQPEGNLSI